jgi:hypothetical protein
VICLEMVLCTDLVLVGGGEEARQIPECERAP